jgi:predicted patatin/cPLA2 family phospholipase
MKILTTLKSIFSISHHKKVLILEGGGMRGIFLTGVLQAFTDQKYFPWKLIIGSSAGALTGAAYAADQIYLARDAYFTKLLTGDFIKIRNILNNKKHILNLDWMIETILKGDEPFDFNKLKKSCPVIITATNCCDFCSPETVYLNSKKDNIDIALKATAAIPFLYRGFVKYKNYNLLDGGLLDPIPFKKALELGYREKDILVITTRPKGYRKYEESFWIKSLLGSYFKNSEYKLLVYELEDRFKKYNKLLDELENKYKSIEIIYPPAEFKVNRLTKDEKKILEGFTQGVRTGRNYLKKFKSL